MDQRQREILEAFVERVREYAIVVMDADSRVIGWFGGAEEITGWRPDEMMGQTLERLFEPVERSLGIHLLELETAAGTGRAEDDRWNMRRDGSRFWANGATIGLRDAAGRLTGFAKVFRDRTDLRLQLDRLENRVHELERRETERVRMLATLAHELRTPLGAIANATALVRQGAPAAVPGDIIARQVDAIGRIVDDVTTLVRHGGATPALDVSRFDVREAVAEAIEACRPQVEERGHRLETFIPARPLECVADRLRLRQLLVNLISNAARYTPEGGHIWVHATREGEETVLSVRDNGAGIPPDLQPRVFDLFTRAGGAANGGESGLGLGLALVKEIAELHGGSVQVRSEGTDKGSEFTVCLPRREAPADASLAPGATAPARSA